MSSPTWLRCVMLASISASIPASLVLIPIGAGAQSLDEIVNFRTHSERLASAGQPTAEQLELIRNEGFERIIYLAFTEGGGAIADEDRRVRSLGMDYVQIPVLWESPTVADFESFAAVMQSASDKKTLVHCQLNMRATAFTFLYQVIFEGVPVAQAKAEMNSVWEPNDTWRDLIFAVLASHGLSPECSNCDSEL